MKPSVESGASVRRRLGARAVNQAQSVVTKLETNHSSRDLVSGMIRKRNSLIFETLSRQFNISENNIEKNINCFCVADRDFWLFEENVMKITKTMGSICSNQASKDIKPPADLSELLQQTEKVSAYVSVHCL